MFGNQDPEVIIYHAASGKRPRFEFRLKRLSRAILASERQASHDTLPSKGEYGPGIILPAQLVFEKETLRSQRSESEQRYSVPVLGWNSMSII